MSGRNHDITIALLYYKVKSNWKLFACNILIATAVMTAYMLSKPDYYRSTETVKYSPISSSVAAGLHSVGSYVGFDLGSVKSNTDAIFLPHFVIMTASEHFLERIMKTEITTRDGQRMSYYEHVRDEYDVDKDEIFELVRKNIVCMVDTKKNICTFSVQDYDAQVCAIMASAISDTLRLYMTQYRQEKYRQRVAFLESIYDSVSVSYENSAITFDSYGDVHHNLSRGTVMERWNRLRQDVWQKQAIQRAVAAHLQEARSFLSDRTPVFTTLEKAAIQAKPAGPSRAYGIISMAILAFLATMVYVIKDDIIYQLR
ncbi:MAG: hypothetical protein J5486_08200 [Bacteroidaceae bacterium]|nr:hypothetical protein [Bacteroidaceae bacterium]